MQKICLIKIEYKSHCFGLCSLVKFKINLMVFPHVANKSKLSNGTSPRDEQTQINLMILSHVANKSKRLLILLIFNDFIKVFFIGTGRM